MPPLDAPHVAAACHAAESWWRDDTASFANEIATVVGPSRATHCRAYGTVVDIPPPDEVLRRILTAGPTPSPTTAPSPSHHVSLGPGIWDAIAESLSLSDTITPHWRDATFVASLPEGTGPRLLIEVAMANIRAPPPASTPAQCARCGHLLAAIVDSDDDSWTNSCRAIADALAAPPARAHHPSVYRALNSLMRLALITSSPTVDRYYGRTRFLEWARHFGAGLSFDARTVFNCSIPHRGFGPQTTRAAVMAELVLRMAILIRMIVARALTTAHDYTAFGACTQYAMRHKFVLAMAQLAPPFVSAYTSGEEASTPPFTLAHVEPLYTCTWSRVEFVGGEVVRGPASSEFAVVGETVRSRIFQLYPPSSTTSPQDEAALGEAYLQLRRQLEYYPQTPDVPDAMAPRHTEVPKLGTKALVALAEWWHKYARRIGKRHGYASRISQNAREVALSFVPYIHERRIPSSSSSPGHPLPPFTYAPPVCADACMDIAMHALMLNYTHNNTFAPLGMCGSGVRAAIPRDVHLEANDREIHDALLRGELDMVASLIADNISTQIGSQGNKTHKKIFPSPATTRRRLRDYSVHANRAALASLLCKVLHFRSASRKLGSKVVEIVADGRTAVGRRLVACLYALVSGVVAPQHADTKFPPLETQLKLYALMCPRVHPMRESTHFVTKVLRDKNVSRALLRVMLHRAVCAGGYEQLVSTHALGPVLGQRELAAIARTIEKIRTIVAHELLPERASRLAISAAALRPLDTIMGAKADLFRITGCKTRAKQKLRNEHAPNFDAARRLHATFVMWGRDVVRALKTVRIARARYGRSGRLHSIFVDQAAATVQRVFELLTDPTRLREPRNVLVDAPPFDEEWLAVLDGGGDGGGGEDRDDIAAIRTLHDAVRYSCMLVRTIDSPAAHERNRTALRMIWRYIASDGRMGRAPITYLGSADRARLIECYQLHAARESRVVIGDAIARLSIGAIFLQSHIIKLQRLIETVRFRPAGGTYDAAARFARAFGSAPSSGLLTYRSIDNAAQALGVGIQNGVDADRHPSRIYVSFCCRQITSAPGEVFCGSALHTYDHMRGALTCHRNRKIVHRFGGGEGEGDEEEGEGVEEEEEEVRRPTAGRGKRKRRADDDEATSKMQRSVSEATRYLIRSRSSIDGAAATTATAAPTTAAARQMRTPSFEWPLCFWWGDDYTRYLAYSTGDTQRRVVECINTRIVDFDMRGFNVSSHMGKADQVTMYSTCHRCGAFTHHEHSLIGYGGFMCPRCDERSWARHRLFGCASCREVRLLEASQTCGLPRGMLMIGAAKFVSIQRRLAALSERRAAMPYPQRSGPYGYDTTAGGVEHTEYAARLTANIIAYPGEYAPALVCRACRKWLREHGIQCRRRVR